MNPPASPHAIPARWRLADALLAHPELQVVPSGGDEVLITGTLRFAATGLDATLIEDSYSIELRIPRTYPSRGFPSVFETAQRIPMHYHHLDDGAVCLGAPSRLRLFALRTPSIADFMSDVVIPYFYGRSYYERYGRMPFGELAHGSLGLARDLIAMLGMPSGTCVDRLCRVASMRRRHANKRLCPCHSGQRLGKCHNVQVNWARAKLGRGWFSLHRRGL